jgi:hypothetical protein
MQLFLDESGYSGHNLLDAEQPLLTLATLGLAEEECRQIKHRHFGRSQMNELKHAMLARRTTGQHMVLSFLDDLLARCGAFRIYMAHKRFALVQMFVLYVIEPAFRAWGLNLMEGGKHISFAHAIYRLIPAIEGAEYFDRLLSQFQEMLRARTPDSVAALRSHIHSRHLDPRTEGLMEPAKVYLGSPSTEEEIAGIPANALDLSLTFALPIMSLWREDVGPEEPILLYHDQSSAMARQSDWWEFLTGAGREQYRAAAGTIGFPIGLVNTEFVNSKDWAGVQLTDVIAGAFNRACLWEALQKPAGDAYGRQLNDRLHRTEDRAFMFLMPADPDERLLREDANEIVNYVGHRFRDFRTPR